MVENMIKKCLKCGREFKTWSCLIKKGLGKYCSKKCHYIRNGEIINKQCLNCGKEFQVYPSSNIRKYCSQRCMGKWRSKNLSGENSPAYRGGSITKNCLVCGKEFKTIPSQIKKGKGKYCSWKCYLSIFGEVYKNCLVCGKKFKTQKHLIKIGGGKYCSRKCSDIAHITSLIRTCQVCQKKFKVYQSKFKRGQGKYCSRRCMGLMQKKRLKILWLNSEFAKEQLRKMRAKWGVKPTSIEKTLYDYLLLKGILFEKQYLVNGKFLVDAYIPSLNLVIEADGKYWHTRPKTVEKDKRENAYLTKCGFNLLRLGEEEINNGSFKERLVS